MTCSHKTYESSLFKTAINRAQRKRKHLHGTFTVSYTGWPRKFYPPFQFLISFKPIKLENSDYFWLVACSTSFKINVEFVGLICIKYRAMALFAKPTRKKKLSEGGSNCLRNVTLFFECKYLRKRLR